MHDIKNRFFGSGLGQIVMILWPFVHLLVLVGVYYFTKRPNPYGESIIQYGTISVFPFIVFNYVSRWIVFSAVTNKNFLHYPIIKPIDILVGRMCLEIISITIVGILLLIFVSICGYSVMPFDCLDAAFALMGTLFLSIGFGFLNAPLAFLMPLWNTVMVFFIIIVYIASGVAFVPAFLPNAAKLPLSYNPLLSCVEWFRVSYYSDYPTEMLDRLYVLECGLVMLAIGLVLNTLLKRYYVT